MQDVPPQISAAFEKVKKTYPFYVSLKRIYGKYYVYKVKVVWDRLTKKTKTNSEYLGRITSDGKYKKKSITPNDYLRKAEALIASKGGKITWDGIEKVRGANEQIKEEQIEETVADELETKILTILSMNGRASIPFISKMVGLSNATTDYHVKKIEEKYGIRYFPEIDVDKLGYASFMISIKFEDEVPSAEEIKRELSKFPGVQLAMVTHGRYDLIIHFVTGTEYMPNSYGWASQNEIYDLQNNAFRANKAKWYVSTFYRTYGCVPLRNEFFDMMKKIVWEKSKESRRPKPNQLLPREYFVLKELNLDGRCEFTEIDNRCNFDRGRSDYTYKRLVENKTIKRITLTMQKPPVKYVAIIYMDFIKRDEFSKSRVNLLLDIIERRTQINKYALVGDASIPYGGFFILPITQDGLLEKVTEQLKSISGTNVYALVASEIVLGSLCYRLFDNAYSSQQRMLADEYKKHPVEKANYLGVAKTKKSSIKLDIRGLPTDKSTDDVT